MILILRYVVIQNEHENTKYKVLDDVKLNWSKRRYLELEDCKTYKHRTIPIGFYVGSKRLIVSEEILSNVEISPKYIFAKVINDVLVIEYSNF